MLFSSMTFISVFLPIVFLIYFLSKGRCRNFVLLLASIVFYAWGEPKYVIVMLFSIFVNYTGALALLKYKKYAKLILLSAILINLGVLFYFKYFNFFIENMNALLSTNWAFWDIVMPIGISFYTFQAMSYLIDVYRGEVTVQKNIFDLALYISLFPQLVAGPIVKYHDVADQIKERKVSLEDVSYGVKRFIVGLSKKVLIANTLGLLADKVFSQPVNQFDTLIAWIGAIAYSFQIYYDFSGYSDMAIGLGSIFGFKFLENFNYPYVSKSITEFWRRWHISLSTWFKEYLYIPLGGNRVTKLRMYLNLLIVFLATGIWHGAQWTFVIWGLWNGFFIILEKLTNWHQKTANKIIAFSQHLYTIFVFVFGWILFRADNIAYANQYIKKMFFLGVTNNIKYHFLYYVDNFEVVMMIIALICSMPIFKNMLQPTKNEYKLFLLNSWLLILFVLSLSSIVSQSYNPFIYFRF